MSVIHLTNDKRAFRWWAPCVFYSFIVSPISEENVPGEKWGSAGGQGGKRCLRDGTRQPLLEFEFKQRWFQEGQFWLSLTLKISNWNWFLLMEWDCITRVTVVKPLKSPRPGGKMGSGAAESRGRRKVAKKVTLLPGDRVYLLVDKTTEQLCIM